MFPVGSASGDLVYQGIIGGFIQTIILYLSIEGGEGWVVAVGRDVYAVGGGVGGNVAGREHLGEDLQRSLETFARVGRQSHNLGSAEANLRRNIKVKI